MDLSLPIDRLTERIDHSAEKLLSDRYAGTLSRVDHAASLSDLILVTEQNHTDRIDAQVLDHSLDAGIKDNDFSVHRKIKPCDTRNPVTDPHDCTDLFLFGLKFKILDPCLQNRNNLLILQSLILSCFFNKIPKLLLPPGPAPVIHIIPDMQNKTVSERLVLPRGKLQLSRLKPVAPSDRFLKRGQLFGRRSGGIDKLCLPSDLLLTRHKITSPLSQPADADSASF